jgi:1-acyl-sn-glycerol-3-phosphate acyltransferase
MENEFDDIRPYTDKEIPVVLSRLLKDKTFIRGLRQAVLPKFPSWLSGPADMVFKHILKKKFKTIKTIDDFQKEITVRAFLKPLIRNTTAGVTQSGLEALPRDRAYIFMSNHRDIVLDSALLNCVLLDHGFKIAQIAFGDNLLINDTVSDLIRINKSFIVKRNLPLRQQIEASKHLSSYINHVLKDGESIWIAQREGRSKDGNDTTNPAIVKMFHLCQRSGGMDFSSYVNFCNIVPVSISYELDPCDTLKGWERLRRLKNTYQKTKYLDLVSIFAGIKRQKGRIHFAFGRPLAGEFENDKQVAEAIDRSVQLNYKLWSTNYIAYDALEGKDTYKDQYTEEEKLRFLQRYRKLTTSVRKFVLESYANPVRNKEAVAARQ